ncbi:hypothetical protein NPIL_269631 [Nephila pilipes]|uniref:Uncharacterized protein n=1 Tax=Nephila pilipes TaxID=299642 RepID=A0A8X6PBJ9_NEPPI|nr:hypothetical protein NPIL_269631 [Nephila pilipes]
MFQLRIVYLPTYLPLSLQSLTFQDVASLRSCWGQEPPCLAWRWVSQGRRPKQACPIITQTYAIMKGYIYSCIANQSGNLNFCLGFFDGRLVSGESGPILNTGHTCNRIKKHSSNALTWTVVSSMTRILRPGNVVKCES